MILYLCRKCGNINWHIHEVVYEHLIVDGFIRGYKKRIFHGECTPRRTSSTINPACPHNAHYQSVREDDMEGMLRDTFNMRSHGLQSFSPDWTISLNYCRIRNTVKSYIFVGGQFSWFCLKFSFRGDMNSWFKDINLINDVSTFYFGDIWIRGWRVPMRSTKIKPPRKLMNLQYTLFTRSKQVKVWKCIFC